MQCAKLDGTFKKQLKDNVWNLEETNKNTDKVTVVLNGGEYNIERFRGGTKVKNGYVLGEQKDYEGCDDAEDHIKAGSRCRGVI